MRRFDMNKKVKRYLPIFISLLVVIASIVVLMQFVSFYNKNKKERESLLKEIERFQDVNIEFKNKEEAVVSPRENPNLKFFVFFRPTEWLVSSIGE